MAHLQRYGATTRVRANGGRMFVETRGLTMATFRQSTSRADDPQLHAHAVISAKVRTDDGRWLALDTRYLKRHQRMLGGLYQSALRAAMAERLGVAWGLAVSGQAEIAGVPEELLRALSKRTPQVEAALADKIDDFRFRQGRDPMRWERAALTREAAVDTRTRKTGNGVPDLMTRWRDEADRLGWTPERVLTAVRDGARDRVADNTLTVDDVLDRLSTAGSTRTRADVVRAVCTAREPRQITSHDLDELIQPLTAWLTDRGIAPPERRIARDHGLGLGL